MRSGADAGRSIGQAKSSTSSTSRATRPAPSDGGLGILQPLVNSVRDQIDDLESQGKKDESKALKKGFSLLLDRVAAKGNKLPIKMKALHRQGLSTRR